MNRPKNDVVVSDKLITQFSSFLSTETLKLLNGYGKPYGTSFSRRLIISFLAKIVETLLKNALNSQIDQQLSDRERYVLTSKAFEQIKFDIQESIARGFETALGKFSKHAPQYYCVVKPMPEPINKETH